MAEQRDLETLVIGSRGSQLALWQSEYVSECLEAECRIKVIKTSGDRFLDQSLQGQADKGFFTKEIEDELLAGEVDLAVHSLKDLPTTLPEGLALGALMKRVAPSDLLLVRPERVFADAALPVVAGSVVGATSLRRQALLRRFAPDLDPAMLRGNVPTRIRKLRDGEYDAIIIARAGVDRLKLDLEGLAVFELNPEIWLPAPGQAVMGIEIREGDSRIIEAVSPLADDLSARAVCIERDLLARFEGGCHTAFGSLARPSEKGVDILVGHEDEAGRWLAAQVFADDDQVAMDAAYEKLSRVLKTGLEEDKWSGKIAVALNV